MKALLFLYEYAILYANLQFSIKILMNIGQSEGEEAHLMRAKWVATSHQDALEGARNYFHWNALLLGLVFMLTGCGGAGDIAFSSYSSSDPTTVTGTVLRPKGKGPFPAVVLLHTCGGVHAHEFDWAERLVNDGYVAMVVDSFSPRNIINCRDVKGGRSLVLADAYGALLFLRKQPFVGEKRIGVMGFSLGGEVALMTGGWIGLKPDDDAFLAAVALYPGCDGFDDAPKPTLLLMGEQDPLTQYCIDVAKYLKEQGRKVEWKVYPNVHHGFDQDKPPRTRHGEYFEYNYPAVEDSWVRIRAFLNEHLRNGK